MHIHHLKLYMLIYNSLVVSSYMAMKGGEVMRILFSFILSVAAGIVANYICKWLDRKISDNQPED